MLLIIMLHALATKMALRGVDLISVKCVLVKCKYPLLDKKKISREKFNVMGTMYVITVFMSTDRKSVV